MKILITIPSLSGYGGVANYYRTLTPHLIKDERYKFRFLEIGSTKSSNFVHPVLDQIKFYRITRNNRFDLIHINPSLDPKSLLRDGIFIFLAKIRKIPVLVFFHGWDKNFEKKIRKKWWSYYRRTFLKANGFIVLSKNFADKLSEWNVNVPIYIETTNVDKSLLNDFKIEDKIQLIKKEKKIKILYLARIEKVKGIFETIEAVKIIIDHGYNVSLTIAGNGNAYEEVCKKIEKNGLKEIINLAGYVTGDKKKNILHSHHIYCLPTSHGEGMPISILEAMAFGMPIITNPIGGIQDMFENGKMGYLPLTNKPENIAKYLEILIKNKNKMIEIALYNHKYATKHFLSTAVAKRLKQIYFKQGLIMENLKPKMYSSNQKR